MTSPDITIPSDARKPRSLAFYLPLVLPSLNVRDRTHWGERHRQKDQLTLEIMAAIGGPAHYPRPPFSFCRITVVRHGKQMLDPDNLTASCKPLLDCLCERSTKHPTGLGIIRDDHPGMVELVVHQQPATGDPCTVVRIEDRPQPFDPSPRKPKKARPPGLKRYPPRKPSKAQLRISAKASRP